MNPINHHKPTYQDADHQHQHTMQDVQDTRTALMDILQDLLDVGNKVYQLSENLPCYELSRLPMVLCLLTDEVDRLTHALDTAQSKGNASQLLDKDFWLPTHQ